MCTTLYGFGCCSTSVFPLFDWLLVVVNCMQYSMQYKTMKSLVQSTYYKWTSFFSRQRKIVCNNMNTTYILFSRIWDMKVWIWSCTTKAIIGEVLTEIPNLPCSYTSQYKEKWHFRNKTFFKSKICKIFRIKHYSLYIIYCLKFFFQKCNIIFVKAVLDFVIFWRILILVIH